MIAAQFARQNEKKMLESYDNCIILRVFTSMSHCYTYCCQVLVWNCLHHYRHTQSLFTCLRVHMYIHIHVWALRTVESTNQLGFWWCNARPWESSHIWFRRCAAKFDQYFCSLGNDSVYVGLRPCQASSITAVGGALILVKEQGSCNVCFLFTHTFIAYCQLYYPWLYTACLFSAHVYFAKVKMMWTEWYASAGGWARRFAVSLVFGETVIGMWRKEEGGREMFRRLTREFEGREDRGSETYVIHWSP